MAKLQDDFPSAEHLNKAGYTTLAKLQKASDEDLLAVEHIGPAALEKIRAASQEPHSEVPELVEVSSVETDAAPYECPAPLCGHTITVSPCPYCGR